MGSKELPGFDRNQWRFQKKGPVDPTNFWERGFRHTDTGLSAAMHLGLSLVKFQRARNVLRVVLDWGLLKFPPGFIPVFRCLLQIEEGLCLDGYRLVAPPQRYLLVCIWGSLVKFQGVGLFQSLMCYRTGMQFFLCSLHASNETLLLMFQVSKQLNWRL